MLYFLILAFLFLSLPAAAKAVCPICTVAVCAGVGFSRWLGVDDTITGLWIGGLTISVSLWTINWLSGKNIKFFGRQPLIYIIYYTLVIWPLNQFQFIGHPLNKLWGVDKLTLGIIIGSIGFIIGVLTDKYLRKRNNNQAYFPFEKVIMPVGALLILSLTLYLICAYKLF